MTKSINNFRRIKIKMDINLKRINNFVKLKTFGTPSFMKNSAKI